ncbi:hypothetical protein GFL63_20890 [Rhizobium leguminosarum bv. viciae]|uniref:ATP-binding protein n=1 Tax=Rhizobium leguminosarum TaxID=384 RepID=UPI001441FC1C|nr:ATP-binding protein [Rhizobium leguminosarum]NKK01212.1 hypothetical protein [Rhizobium leguminosarum bv. viciae]
MPDFPSVVIPAPRNWQDFERCCRVLFECVLGDPQTTAHGRSGQRQNGVDIYGRWKSLDGTLVGIQCKRKDGAPHSALKTRELRREVVEAMKFEPPLAHFILVTTAQTDEKIQSVTRELEEELRSQGRIVSIAIWGWDRLTQEISQHPRALRAFLPDWSPFTDEILEGQKQLGEDIRRIAEKIDWKPRLEELRSRIELGQAVSDRVELHSFAGREWLLDEIERFLNQNDRGFILIEAAAGLGKTTFLAHLANSRNLPRHFVELMPGASGVESGLRNLAAQTAILAANRLEETWIARILGTQSFQPHDFGSFLRAIASADEPLVLVVDGLDEAGHPDGLNPLGLPAELPKGIFIVASTRPGTAVNTRGPRLNRVIAPQSDENVRDMREFLQRAAGKPPLADLLFRQNRVHSVDNFVSHLCTKSQGVWIYLHYVLGEIERGERVLTDLSSLPEGLEDYYADWILRWRQRDEAGWDGELLPLLSFLAVSREPLPLTTICQIAGIAESARLRRLLDGMWRSFVIASDASGDRTYTLYHASFAQFLASGPKADMDQARKQLAEELKHSVRAAHDKVCDFFFNAWGGIKAGLPLLRSPAHELCSGYGRRHIVAHLFICGRMAEGHSLLLLETSEKSPSRAATNTWYAVRAEAGELAGFVEDVRFACLILLRRIKKRNRIPAAILWDRIFGSSEPHEASIDVSEFGTAVLYALILCSMNSIASSTPPELLPILVRSGAWALREAVEHARRIPDEFSRSIALAAVAEVAGEDRDSLLSEATATAFHINNNASSILALAMLARIHSGKKAVDIQRLVMRELMELSPGAAFRSLNEIAPQLAARERNDALLSLIQIHGDDAAHLPRGTVAVFRTLSWAEGRARQGVITLLHNRLGNGQISAICHNLLSVALPYLDETEQRTVLADGRVVDWLAWDKLPLAPTAAFDLWTRIAMSQDDLSIRALFNLVPSLVPKDAGILLQQLSTLDSWHGSVDEEKTALLTALSEQSARHQSGRPATELDLREMLELANEIDEPWERDAHLARILAALDPRSPPSPGFVRLLLASHQTLDDGKEGTRTIAAYADALPPEQFQKFIEEMNSELIQDGSLLEPMDGSLARFATHLPSRARRSYLKAVLEMQYPGMMSFEIIKNVGLLAANAPPRQAEEAWNAVMETLANGELLGDEHFLELIFGLSSSLKEPYAGQLLDIVADRESPYCQAQALWALAPFVQAQSLERAWAISRNLDPSGPGLLARAAIAASSRDPERTSDVRQLIEKADDDDGFLTAAMAALIPALENQEQASFCERLGARLDPVTDHFPFAIVAHVQLAILFNDNARTTGHWRAAFAIAARETHTAHIVHWLATQAHMTLTVPRELEAVDGLMNTMPFSVRWHAFNLLEAVEPLISSPAERAMVCRAIEIVRRWWP